MSLISCPTPRPWRDRLMPLAAALLLAACAAPSPQLAPPIARHAASAAFSDGIGMRFVLIPAGEFMMGSDESPQALAQAFAASKHGGMPFFWKEKEFDHDDKAELLIGAVQGTSKVRWAVDQGNNTKHFTDHGVIAIDTAVPIIGARQ